MENMIYTYIFIQEIDKATKKIVWFSNHIMRCKNQNDRVKLIALVIVEKNCLEKLILELNKTAQQMIDDLIPKKCYKENKICRYNCKGLCKDSC